MKKCVLMFLAVVVVFMFASFVSADEGIEAERPCPPRPETTQCPVGPQCNEFTFDATTSYHPSNQKLSYLWDFGDGTTGTEPVVKHLYQKSGQYTVKLTVKDASGLPCDTGSTTQVVNVNTPPVPLFAALESACVGDTVTFDASATTDDTLNKLTYAWDFGDGTKGEGKVVKKSYQKGGAYNARLTVDDNAGSACSVASTQKGIVINSNPVADAGNDLDLCFAPNQEMSVTLNGGNSRDPEGDTLSYKWDLGDGTDAEGQSVSHVYRRAGTYTAKLVVDDGRKTSCSSGVDTVAIKLNKKPLAVAGKDTGICLGESVRFDGSASQAPEGSKLSYAWDFGDGTKGEGVTTSHTYEKEGNYRAILTVDDGKGSRCSIASSALNVVVNSAPKACLTNIPAACIGQSVTFDACCSKAKKGCGSLSYTWDFGDGTTTKTPCCSTTHAYTKGGDYTVRVTVDDRKGTPCSTDSATSSIKINTRPVAKAGADLACCQGIDSVFDGSGSSDADGDSLTYNWDFGDGTTAQGVRVTHAYAKGGSYKVTLKVDDNSGTSCNSSTVSMKVSVKGEPVAKIKCK